MVKKKEAQMEDLPHLESESDGKSKRKAEYIDVFSTETELTGAAGLLELFLRRYKGSAQMFALFPALIAYILALSISITPGYILVASVLKATAQSHIIVQGFAVSFSFIVSCGIFGLLLILVIPLFNKLMPFKSRHWRGNWFSIQTIPWYYHNALTQLVRFTVLDFITPTPLNIMFYRLMGMKIGRNCILNTTNISDPCMIELEDNVTVGGSATIFGHYAQGGILVFAPVTIKRGATVGLKASIMGDVIVGEKVTVKPHAVLLPKTRLYKGDPQ